ncbi:MAG: radical SAM protein [Candidatus Hydrothermarchaeota archaeon]|nr:radical SAM protein [Candidatus Hydrothermarchaeota archaeon]
MKTTSLCPECLCKIEAEVIEENGRVIMEKSCPEHGDFKDIYWSDAELYRRFMKFNSNGRVLANPITKEKKGCPYDCGICSNHKSATILANVDVTNRCNQHCPICFANADEQGYLYEPSKKQIYRMMLTLRNEKPAPCSVIQFSGGEPTVREDLPELIRMAKELGFIQIQIATNGIRLSNSVEYVKKLKEAGLNTVYLQFDGLTETPYIHARGYNALPKKLVVIENCRAAGLNSVTLVPTLVKGVNDNQVGSMIDFCVKNRDVVCSLNVQPVSFTGRIDKSELEKRRITIPDFLALVEEQTDGQIAKKDFYPIPCVGSISHFIEVWKGNIVPFPSCHPACGAATFVFIDDGRLIPLTRFIDIDGILELTEECAAEISKNGKLGKVSAVTKFSKKFPRLVDYEAMPKSSIIPKLVIKILKDGSREALAELFENTLFIGCMHFQDLYNFDCDRVSKCVIHYATPDGRVIPFCTYNTIHRKEVERKFAMPLQTLRVAQKGV